MRKILCIFVLLQFIPNDFSPQGTAQTPAPVPEPPEIKVQISTEKRRFRVGEAIGGRVEVFNVSKKTLRVGRSMEPIYNWPFSIDIWLEDEAGNQVPGGGVGIVDPRPHASEIMEDGVQKWWVVLPPGYFYGKEAEFISGRSLPKGPGRYRLRGKYNSMGLEGENVGWSSKPLEEKPAPLIPYWKGEVETNSIWIEVVSPPKQNQKPKQN